MTNRLPTWAILIYVAIDLANPFVAGAFRFTAEEGAVWVEGASHPRLRADAAPREAPDTAPHLGPAFAEGRRLDGEQSMRRGHLLVWLVRTRTADPPARDLPPPTSDEH